MYALALVALGIGTLTAAVRLTMSVREGSFSPLVFWYAFLLVLLYSRLATLMLVDMEYRWINGATSFELSGAVFILVLLSLVASACVEAGLALTSGVNRATTTRLSYSLPISLLPLGIGLAAFAAYFAMLGGVGSLIDNLARSKSVSGGGILLMFGALVWITPIMVIANRGEALSKTRLCISLTCLALAIVVVSLYGRATPLLWGVLLALMGANFCLKKVRVLRLLAITGPIVIGFLIYKAHRLSISWDREIVDVLELARFYGDVVIADGGEQAITDMSLRVLMWGGQDFPLGTFWQRWITWPVELLPSMLFPFEMETNTVGRQMYWWATGRHDIDSGVPVLGFVSAYITGSIGLLVAAYTFLGALVGKAYNSALQGRASGVVAYTMALCLLLFFTRIGDFSAAVVQVTVLGGVAWLLLHLLDSFFVRTVPFSHGKSEYARA